MHEGWDEVAEWSRWEKSQCQQRKRAVSALEEGKPEQHGTQRVLARQAEMYLHGLQLLVAWKGKGQVRGLQHLPGRQAETLVRGVQPMSSRKSHPQLYGL